MSDENEWLVSSKTCKGCKWFGYLCKAGGGTRCCDYTYMTGKVRKNPPHACEVKKLGRRERRPYTTEGVVVHRWEKNLSKPDMHTPI